MNAFRFLWGINLGIFVINVVNYCTIPDPISAIAASVAVVGLILSQYGITRYKNANR